MVTTNTTIPDRARRWQTLAFAALLAAAAFLAYWPALTGGFIWDDDTLLTKSELVKAPDGLYRIWVTTEPLDYWPMTNSSFWLEWRLWGLHATGYHVTNLLLHIGSALLVWAILRRLAIPGALLAALLFVLHPVNVESVAWIAQRKNTLSMVLFLVSILLYQKHDLGSVGGESRRASASPGRHGTRQVPSGGPPQSGLGRWYWLSLVAFVLAMLSKGSVAILPGVLLLLIWWRRGAVTRSDLMRTLPFFLVAAALTLLNIWFQLHFMTGAIRDVTVLQRVLGAGAVVWFYLYKALLPVGLSFVYPQWEIRAGDVRWWLPLTAALATTALLAWQRRRPAVRALLFAWAFFCLALLPVMGIADVYYMTYSLVADHYQYIAMLGVVVLVAAGLSRLSDLARAREPRTETTSPLWLARLRSRTGVARPLSAGVWCGAVLAVLGTATWRQSHEYADAETLYRATLVSNPSCWLVHNLLGVLLVDRSIDEAVSHFREAIRLKPDLAEAHNNLCHASAQLGRVNAAVDECSEALRINPNLPTAHNDLGAALASLGRFDRARAEFEAALRLDGRYSDAHNNLANILARAGQEAEAVDHYREAVRTAPEFAAAHSNLGFALERQGKIDEAVEQYREALRIEPGLAEARARLDVLLQKSGRIDAVERYKGAVRLHPNQPGTRVDLASALLEAGRPEEAVAEYTAALKDLPNSPTAHSGLASALEDLRRFDEAEEHFRAAIRLKPDFAEAHLSLGDLLQERGRIREAAVQYTEALQHDPRSAEAHNNLGVVLARLGRTDEAVDHFKAALALHPGYADARNNLNKALKPR